MRTTLDFGRARLASMTDRMAARIVDLFLMGATFAVMLLPIPILHGTLGDIGLGGGPGRINLAENGLFRCGRRSRSGP